MESHWCGKPQSAFKPGVLFPLRPNKSWKRARKRCRVLTLHSQRPCTAAEGAPAGQQQRFIRCKCGGTQRHPAGKLGAAARGRMESQHQSKLTRPAWHPGSGRTMKGDCPVPWGVLSSTPGDGPLPLRLLLWFSVCTAGRQLPLAPERCTQQPPTLREQHLQIPNF